MCPVSPQTEANYRLPLPLVSSLIPASPTTSLPTRVSWELATRVLTLELELDTLPVLATLPELLELLATRGPVLLPLLQSHPGTHSLDPLKELYGCCPVLHGLDRLGNPRVSSQSCTSRAASRPFLGFLSTTDA